ncbi:PHB depolymerase family esterase [Oribacterium sp. WCC10]|uniref:PHB depolymerase family esterase n=1 Tax=Oribacterium sp. WCC10 TaxID=1855343 RepID=UPI0008ED3023|nr:PHB depolymerase family esterase [Oribacterium sp. WCC10]SFG13026.1 Esterase PHB depolymerase [Oribacterium sp. WCC10]
MRDTMNRPEKFSPYGGQLILEKVKGTTSGKLNPENDVDTVCGQDRDMYSYIPASGCPHAKQTQVFMVLRDSDTKESAESLIRSLGLDRLSEERHFILLFPNPLQGGWNYEDESGRDDDKAFLVRCFAALPKSQGGVAGFNGMIFYLGTTRESSAMAMTLASKSPLDAAAIMIGEFPEKYNIPDGPKAPQNAWLYEPNTEAETYLNSVNAPVISVDDTESYSDSVVLWASAFANKDNNGIRHFVSEAGLSEATLQDAWERMFSETRRWRNDKYGIYQKRVNFDDMGFMAHVDTDELHVPEDDDFGIKRTWYEYVPVRHRGKRKKLPVVFYFHGINCTPLYGAEQSEWATIAEREGFIAVFPAPAEEERWNGQNDPRLPSDVEFVMKLIEHVDKKVHPVDRTRIYISGFSMGSMFTNALASSYPDVFAGAVAINGPNIGYFQTLEEALPGLLMFRPDSRLKNIKPNGEKASPIRMLSDDKKKKYDYRMPFVQFAGELDGLGFAKGRNFPMKSKKDGIWIDTIDFWKKYNGIPVTEDMFEEGSVSGLKADKSEDRMERFYCQTWNNQNDEQLYHFITARRMPHAVDKRELEIGWEIIKHYVRNSDGTLGYKK